MQGTDSIVVHVNGEVREVAPGQSVEQLLRGLGLHPQMIVVEHNREILERARYAETPVRAGDNLELVHFVGGG